MEVIESDKALLSEYVFVVGALLALQADVSVGIAINHLGQSLEIFAVQGQVDFFRCLFVMESSEQILATGVTHHKADFNFGVLELLHNSIGSFDAGELQYSLVLLFNHHLPDLSELPKGKPQ